METEKFLIQGIIFQDRQDFRIKGIEGITIDTSNGTGSVKSLFHGTVVFEKKESARHGVCGEFSDRWGKSKISKFLISETQLSFYKTYEKRPAIEYSIYKLMGYGMETIKALKELAELLSAMYRPYLTHFLFLLFFKLEKSSDILSGLFILQLTMFF
jgi:hypothetical protein